MERELSFKSKFNADPNGYHVKFLKIFFKYFLLIFYFYY